MKPSSSIAAFALTLLCSPASQAVPIMFGVSLDGASESPANASLGTGTATVTFDLAAHLLSINVSFSGLSGTTTASHIHCCTAVPGAGNIGVATETPTFGGFPLGVTSGSYSNTYDTTLLASFNAPFVTANGGTAGGAEQALFNGMQGGQAYLNIHSSVVASGEIRGFLVPGAAVPEPASLALLGLGALLAIGFRGHKRDA
jgi:CHRD domain/PEP-CTERM motif